LYVCASFYRAEGEQAPLDPSQVPSGASPQEELTPINTGFTGALDFEYVEAEDVEDEWSEDEWVKYVLEEEASWAAHVEWQL
jgi:hypothetical protein